MEDIKGHLHFRDQWFFYNEYHAEMFLKRMYIGDAYRWKHRNSITRISDITINRYKCFTICKYNNLLPYKYRIYFFTPKIIESDSLSTWICHFSAFVYVLGWKPMVSQCYLATHAKELPRYHKEMYNLRTLKIMG